MSTKTKRKVAKLPKGLPKFPKLPDGFNEWEYMGKGCDFNWPDGPGFVGAILYSGRDAWIADTGLCGLSDTAHYIQAIKHPAPKVAKKDGPWSYSPSKRMIRLDAKSFVAVSAPDGSPMSPVNAAILVTTLNKGANA